MKPKITALEARNSRLSVTLDGELPLDRPPPFTTSILHPALLVPLLSRETAFIRRGIYDGRRNGAKVELVATGGSIIHYQVHEAALRTAT
jgi:hypothetical protein